MTGVERTNLHRQRKKANEGMIPLSDAQIQGVVALGQQENEAEERFFATQEKHSTNAANVSEQHSKHSAAVSKKAIATIEKARKVSATHFKENIQRKQRAREMILHGIP